jgi:hypothetical protein
MLAFGCLLPALFLAPAPAVSPPPELQPEVRIQHRFIEKRHRFGLYAGFTYLARADYYRSPGVELAVSYYAWEALAFELRASWYFSSATDELRDLVMRTGFVPDSRPSLATMLVGARGSLGYGKLRVTSRYVLHFDPQAFLYFGAHVTSGDFYPVAAGPMGEAGLGLLFHFTPHWQARLDAGLTVTGEPRTSHYAITVGAHPSLLVGALF